MFVSNSFLYEYNNPQNIIYVRRRSPNSTFIYIDNIKNCIKKLVAPQAPVPTPSQLVFNMSKIIAVLACLAVVLAVVSAESQPRYHKLEKLGCGLDQVILCAGEIEGMQIVLTM